jgi:hypothetical protein
VSDPDIYDRIDAVYKGVTELHTLNRRMGRFLAGMAVALLVAVSGWWLTAQDHSATRRAGRSAECRATAQAKRLDDFAVIVSPLATKRDRDAAADRIAHGLSLEVAYAACGGQPVAVCRDGSPSFATGRGACSSHGGVRSTVKPR